MNMKMKHVSMVLPILLLSVGAIACGSTTRGDASVTHNESEEAVFTPTSYRSTGLDFTKAAESTVNAVVSIRTTTTPKSSGRFNDPFFEFFFGHKIVVSFVNLHSITQCARGARYDGDFLHGSGV